jgi:thiosulfate dehydrogenase
MYKGIVVGILLALAIALIGGYIVVRSGMIPANADAMPGRLETWMATTSLDATLSRVAPQGQNPVPPTDQNLLYGEQLFAQNCSVCHGSEQGVASASPIAKGLYQKPPQFATDGVEDDAEGLSFWKIKHGIRLTGMPSFAPTLNDRQIWTIALFLKHMDKLPPAADQAWKQVRNWPVATAATDTTVGHEPPKQ